MFDIVVNMFYFDVFNVGCCGGFCWFVMVSKEENL